MKSTYGSAVVSLALSVKFLLGRSTKFSTVSGISVRKMSYKLIGKLRFHCKQRLITISTANLLKSCVTDNGSVMYADIGANLTDEMYQGVYNGSKKHEPDLDKVLQRSWNAGLQNIFITAGCLQDIRDSLKLAQIDGEHICYP